MEKEYDLGRIRTLLTRGFTDRELRRLCQDTPDYRPVYDELSLSMGKAEVVSRLLDHAESQMLIDSLLTWTREKNPKRYELHGPYVVGPETGGQTEPLVGSQTPIRILFLAANPTNTTWLRLGEEVRSIKEALRGAEFRDLFELEQEWAVRVRDLQRSLLEHKPHVVHFSGHGIAGDSSGGTGSGSDSDEARRDEPDHRRSSSVSEGRSLRPAGQRASPAGQLVMEDDQGRSKMVPPEALSNLFRLLKDNLRCVVLNACYSEPQARAIAEHIDCVIGMSTAIKGRAAIRFSAALYQALGFGRDVETAFELGCNQLDLQKTDDADTPRLIATRCDPKTVFLVRPPAAT